MNRVIFCACVFAFLLSGCITVPLPPTFYYSGPPADTDAADAEPYPDDESARDLDGPIGSAVSWGGVITGMQGAELQVLALPLDANGQPLTQSTPLGRFLVRTRTPVDTTSYTPGQGIAVSGTIVDNSVIRDDGIYTVIPIVDAHTHRLLDWRQNVTDSELAYYDRQPPYLRQQNHYGHYHDAYPWLPWWPRIGLNLGYGGHGRWTYGIHLGF